MQHKFGLLRSLATYYGNPVAAGRLRRVYAQFLAPGDLYFDVGAHVGNRIRVARKLGARVVALEPHPQFFALLQHRYGLDTSVSLLPEAIGASSGEGTLYASAATPTVSTVSRSWMQLVRQDPAFYRVHWDIEYPVRIATLDSLVARFGIPNFCKIDVEGNELEALTGLTTLLPALSFEYLPAAIDLAVACVQRLEELGSYAYNWCVAERFQFGTAHWLSADEMVHLLTRDLKQGKSGDIYARRSLSPKI